MRLHIGVIGWNAEQTEKAIKKLAKADESGAQKITRNYSTAQDGTRYTAIIAHASKSMMGARFDQLVIVDDSRKEIYFKQGELISRAVEQLTPLFDDLPAQVQFYEW